MDEDPEAASGASQASKVVRSPDEAAPLCAPLQTPRKAILQLGVPLSDVGPVGALLLAIVAANRPSSTLPPAGNELPQVVFARFEALK